MEIILDTNSAKPAQNVKYTEAASKYLTKIRLDNIPGKFWITLPIVSCDKFMFSNDRNDLYYYDCWLIQFNN